MFIVINLLSMPRSFTELIKFLRVVEKSFKSSKFITIKLFHNPLPYILILIFLLILLIISLISIRLILILVLILFIFLFFFILFLITLTLIIIFRIIILIILYLLIFIIPISSSVLPHVRSEIRGFDNTFFGSRFS